jgi:hypothetical protein
MRAGFAALMACGCACFGADGRGAHLSVAADPHRRVVVARRGDRNANIKVD